MNTPSTCQLSSVLAGRFKKSLVSTLIFSATFVATGGAYATEQLQPLVADRAKLTEVSIVGTKAMSAAPLDLSAIGYTEREYYAEGSANRYRGVKVGMMGTAEVIDSNWPYVSRVLVRTPKPEIFNGTLVVEWANVTAGQDIDFAFAESYEYLLREGYAVAVVSAQKMGVDRLKNWSSERYGRLTVDADNIDPKDGSIIDQCIDVRNCLSDPLSWDILTQVTEALKANAGSPQPLPGLDVKKVIALAESQSSVRLTGYYNNIQPLYHTFDGFVFLDLAVQLRSDQPVPAISVNTEVTKEGFGFPVPTTGEYNRIWDVVGASHASKYAIAYVDDMVKRDNSFPSEQGPMTFSQLGLLAGCDKVPNYGIVDTGIVLNKAIDSVNKWIETGTPAAPTLTMEVDSDGKIIRDENGRAKGGVQLAGFAVPTQVFSMNTPSSNMACRLSAHHDDLSDDQLKARYGNHENYVKLVEQRMTELYQAGYILEFDKEVEIAAAKSSDIAR